MKKLILSLLMTVSLISFAGNPEKTNTTKVTKAIKETFVITPQPVIPVTNGHLIDCCHTINLGYDFDGCLNIIFQCDGACGNHGWLITACRGSVAIRGAFEVPDPTHTTPVKVSIPLTVGIVDFSTFDASKDAVSQMMEIKKTENTVINLSDDVTVENDDCIMLYRKGQYVIQNSKLLVVAQ